MNRRTTRSDAIGRPALLRPLEHAAMWSFAKWRR